MFTFYWPWAALLTLLPLLAFLVLPSSEKRTDTIPELLFPFSARLKAAFSTSGSTSGIPAKNSNKLFLVLLLFSWLCLVSALMRPQLVDRYSYLENRGYDLMLVVDISGSMRALDFSTPQRKIDRLDVTKDVVGKFVRARQGDRVGLVLFGEYAHLHVPLTLDTLSVGQMLENVVTGMAGDGTAIGDAIGLAVKNLRDRPEESRVIILLTDGEDTASSIPPLEAAKVAREYGIRIYTVGVGKAGRVPYPNRYGGISMVELEMDEALLKEIAKTADGRYFLATDAKALQDIYDTIDKLEKTEASSRELLIRQPLYRYPLALAAAFLLLLCLAPLARRRTYGT